MGENWTSLKCFRRNEVLNIKSTTSQKINKTSTSTDRNFKKQQQRNIVSSPPNDRKKDGVKD